MKALRIEAYGVLLLGVCATSGCAGGADGGTPLGNELSAVPAAATPSTAPAPTPTPAPAPTPTPTPVPTVMAPKCEPPAKVCEDFETGAINTNVWVVRAPNATLEVVQDRVAHGKYAMHTRTFSDTNSSAQLVQDTFLGENFYGRAYLYFEVKPSNVYGALFEGLGNIQGNATRMSVSVANYLYLGYLRDNPLMEFSSPAADRQSVPVGRWFCLEWNMRPVEGMNNAMWIDGVQVAGNNGVVFHVPAFTEARIGWTHFAHKDPKPFTDIWYDDIAFSDERIGCK